MVSQDMTTSPSLQRIDYPQMSSTKCFQNQNKPPIKVVDMKKLLSKPHISEKSMPLIPSVIQQRNVEEQFVTNRTNPKPLNENAQKLNTPVNKISDYSKTTLKCDDFDNCSCIKISHVYDCLKVILPGNFDLSRLIPNEKLTTLVIKYLKLDLNEMSQNVVKRYLEIIICSVKCEEKTFGVINKHPYKRIKIVAVHVALAILLPRNFSMEAVTNEILRCACVILKQGIFSDGYKILRSKFNHFISSGRRFYVIIKSDVDRILAPENQITIDAKTGKVFQLNDNSYKGFSVILDSQFNQIGNTKKSDNTMRSSNKASRTLKSQTIKKQQTIKNRQNTIACNKYKKHIKTSNTSPVEENDFIDNEINMNSTDSEKKCTLEPTNKKKRKDEDELWKIKNRNSSNNASLIIKPQKIIACSKDNKHRRTSNTSTNGKHESIADSINNTSTGSEEDSDLEPTNKKKPKYDDELQEIINRYSSNNANHKIKSQNIIACSKDNKHLKSSHTSDDEKNNTYINTAEESDFETTNKKKHKDENESREINNRNSSNNANHIIKPQKIIACSKDNKHLKSSHTSDDEKNNTYIDTAEESDFETTNKKKHKDEDESREINNRNSSNNANHIIKPQQIIAGSEDNKHFKTSDTITDEENESSDDSINNSTTDSEEESDFEFAYSDEEDKLWEIDDENKQSEKPIYKRTIHLEDIVAFLSERHLSGEDVIGNIKLLTALCRYLRIRLKKSKLNKLKIALRFIMENNISESNVEHFAGKFNLKKIRALYKELERNKLNLMKKCDSKLKLKPVIKLNDIADFSIDDMLFMRNETESRVPNEIRNQQIPFYFQKDIKQYSSDYVKTLTENSYKAFRKIIMKKNGSKIVFRLKYGRLDTGSEVFIKDYRNPAFGWAKGVVNKVKGCLRYQVRLGNGECYWCVADQLRPLNVESSPDTKVNEVTSDK